MQIKEIITESLDESLSRVAYHYTNTMAALKILKSGYFELSSALGSVEQQYMPRGKPYFMSATRTRHGGYHTTGQARRGVLFVLNGDWFNQRYKSGPIDYWGNRGTNMRPSEAEDRIYSSEPTIPIQGVAAVHVFLDVRDDDTVQQAHDQSIVRQLLIAAKTQGIPAYFYNRYDAWLAMDTRRTADVSQLTGNRKPAWYRPMRRRSYMRNWLELMQATAQNQLSKDADRTRYNLNYGYDKEEAAKALANDMSNARKPDSGQEREDAVKIIRYMQQHKLNTIADFVNHIANKWKNLTKVNEASLPKDQWQLIVSNADKIELGDELVNLVRTAYSTTNLGSMVNSLKEVIPSDWNVIDWDNEPDIDATVFYRYARPKDNWKGVKIQGLGHDGSRTSKDKAISKIQELLNKPGCWIESSDAMRRVLMKLNLHAVTDEKFLQQLFNDPDLKMIDDNTYVRTLANGQTITETVFGYPMLNQQTS